MNTPSMKHKPKQLYVLICACVWMCNKSQMKCHKAKNSDMSQNKQSSETVKYPSVFKLISIVHTKYKEKVKG